MRRWLASPCDGGAFLESGTRSEVCMGQQRVHLSHKLPFFPGARVWWCKACGAWASDRAFQLAEPCTAATRAGLAALSRFRRNMAPGASVWAKAYNRGRLRRRLAKPATLPGG